MSQLVVEMSAEEAKLWQSMQGIIAQQAKMEGGWSKVAAQSRQAERAQNDMARSAQRVLNEIQTPQERYNSRIKELDTLLQHGKLSQDQYGLAVRRARDQMDAAGQAGLDAFGPSARSMVMSLGGSFLSLTGVITGIKKEYQSLFEMQDRAREASITVAEAEREALINLGPKTAEERDQFLAKMEDMSQRTGVSRKDLLQRSSAALSAKGFLTDEEALEAVEVSARLLPGSAEEGKVFAASMMDVDKILSSRGRPISAEEAGGYLMSIGETARITNPKDIAANLAPAVASAMATGADERGAGALFSAFTSSLADVTGAESKTATVKLSAMLAKFVPEKDSIEKRLGADGGIEEQLIAKGTGQTTMEGRIKYLQENEEARQIFLSTADIEPGHRAHVEQLLSGEGAMSQAYEKYYEELPSMQLAAAQFRQKLDVIDASPLQQTAKFGRSVATAREGLQVSDQGAARAGIIRKEYKDLLVDAGLGGLASEMDALGPELTDDSGKVFVEGLKRRSKSLRQGTKPTVVGVGFGGAEVTSPGREPTASDLQKADVLDSLVMTLEESRKQTRLLEEMAQQGKRADQRAGGGVALGKPNEDK